MDRTRLGGGVLSAALFACALGLSCPASAGVIWNESVDGDLTDLYWYEDEGQPDWTEIGALPLGDSRILGTSQRQKINLAWIVDGDAIAFEIAPGTTLASLTVGHDRVFGIREFFRLGADGSTVAEWYVNYPFPPEAVYDDPSDLLSNETFSPGPLGAGKYVMSFDNATLLVATMNYTIDFHVTPEPATLLLLGLGACAVTRRRRTRS